MTVAHVIATTSNGRRSNQSTANQSFTTSVRRHTLSRSVLSGERPSFYRRLLEDDTLIIHRTNPRLGGPLCGRLAPDSWRQAQCQRWLGACAGGRAEQTNRPVGADDEIDVDVSYAKLACQSLATRHQLSHLIHDGPEVGCDDLERYLG
jgi:hypothetical protein